MEFERILLGEIANCHNSKRIPLSSIQRRDIEKIYPYYGAQGIIDYVDDYIFDGKYLLVAEDGENLVSRKEDISRIAAGKFWVNNHAHILSFKDEFDLEYVNYYLNRLDVGKYITGSAQPKLNKKNLLNIIIKWPNRKNRRNIVGFINKYDQKIELNNKIIANLEEQAQAIFKSWFVDFEPFQDGDFVESELGLIPEGWEEVRLKDLIDLYSGYPFKSREYVDNGIYKVVTIKNILDGSLETDKINTIKNKPDDLSDLAELSVSDIIFTMTGNVGRTALVYEKGLLQNQRVGKLLLGDNNNLGFYYFLLRNPMFKEIMINLSHGTAQANLGKTDFLNIKIPYSKNALDQFSLITNNFAYHLMVLCHENKTLAQIRDTLLPKLMSGEIDVSNITIDSEEDDHV